MGSPVRARHLKGVSRVLAAAASRIVSTGVAGYLLLTACAPVRPSGPAAPAPSRAEAAGPLRFLLVYIIHGDGDYIYHDAAGRKRLADEDALSQAREVAEAAPAAEVFIFHQKPRWHIWRHPTPDGMFFHFRRGVLLRSGSYSREGLRPDFEAEARIFARLASPAMLPRLACPARTVPADTLPAGREAVLREPVRFLAYFGHEIPQAGGLGYSRSHPREEFTVPRFARGLERFAGAPCPEDPPYALVVLSACRGGTPATTRALFPYSDWLLASPTELHLSYLDTRAFIPILGAAGSDASWSREPRRLRVRLGAERVLRESFGRLGERTHTPISLALYDARTSAAYLERHPEVAEAPGAMSTDVRLPPFAWRDCAENPDFGVGGEAAGAKVLYRAGRFGILKSKQGHSGWECPQVPAGPWLGDRQPPDPSRAGPEADPPADQAADPSG